MAKVKHYGNVMLNLVARDLNGREFKVFLAWFVDQDSFCASQRLLAKRTGIAQPDIAKILKSLVNKKILVVSGRNAYSATRYLLHDSLLKDAEQITIPEDGDETIDEIAEEPSPEIAQQPSLSSNNPKNLLITHKEIKNSFSGEGVQEDSTQGTFAFPQTVIFKSLDKKMRSIVFGKDGSNRVHGTLQSHFADDSNDILLLHPDKFHEWLSCLLKQKFSDDSPDIRFRFNGTFCQTILTIASSEYLEKYRVCRIRRLKTEVEKKDPDKAFKIMIILGHVDETTFNQTIDRLEREWGVPI